MDQQVYITHFAALIGTLTLASDGEYLLGLWIENQKYFMSHYSSFTEKSDLPVFDQTKAWLKRYFSNEKPQIKELPLRFNGSEFRQIVWNLLCEIPYGQTITYGEIAKKTAQRMNRQSMSAQAVGNAVGHNPISIIVPCHRVIGTNGSLTGYAGGIEIKVRLLRHEGVDLSSLFIPEKEAVR